MVLRDRVQEHKGKIVKDASKDFSSVFRIQEHFKTTGSLHHTSMTSINLVRVHPSKAVTLKKYLDKTEIKHISITFISVAYLISLSTRRPINKQIQVTR